MAGPMSPEKQPMTGEQKLRKRFAEWKYGDEWNAALDDALAAERKATVKRIRAAISRATPIGSWETDMGRVVARFLDAEAADAPA